MAWMRKGGSGAVSAVVHSGARRDRYRGAPLGQRIKGPLMFAYAVIFVFVGGFGAWAALAPLAGGALAPGNISPEGDRRSVQHLEGGIIAELLVGEGAFVEAGQPLVVFDDIAARSRVDALLAQRRVHLANLARIAAEDTGSSSINFQHELASLREQDPEVASLLASQEELFLTRQDQHVAEKNVLDEEIKQLNQEIRGLQAQVESAGKQLAIIAEELQDKATLVEKKLMPKPEFLALKRLEVSLRGDKADYEARIARARQKISEAQLQRVRISVNRAAANAAERDRRLADLVQLSEALQTSNDVLQRTTVTAPVSGHVQDLTAKTVGGVVAPSSTIMQLVPAEDELIVEARVPVQDIDVVAPYQRAIVELSAFAKGGTPRVEGKVRSLAADRTVDPVTGSAFYLARIEVSRDEVVAVVGDDAELVPGMPANVLIISSERTFLSYLLRPVVDSFHRAFREVEIQDQ